MLKCARVQTHLREKNKEHSNKGRGAVRTGEDQSQGCLSNHSRKPQQERKLLSSEDSGRSRPLMLPIRGPSPCHSVTDKHIQQEQWQGGDRRHPLRTTSKGRRQGREFHGDSASRKLQRNHVTHGRQRPAEAQGQAWGLSEHVLHWVSAEGVTRRYGAVGFSV